MFEETFFDVRKHKAKKGQVLAKFTAIAAFGSGMGKEHVVDLLLEDRAESAAAVMHKIHCARYPDNYRVCREICEDLLANKTLEEVYEKEYEFVLEMLFYTNKENVPYSHHWETLPVLKYDSETNSFKSDIHIFHE